MPTLKPKEQVKEKIEQALDPFWAYPEAAAYKFEEAYEEILHFFVSELKKLSIATDMTKDNVTEQTLTIAYGTDNAIKLSDFIKELES